MDHSPCAPTNGSMTNEKYYMISTIGMSVIAESFRSAAYLFISSGFRISSSGCLKQKVKDARESLAFISGTGLDIVIQEFNLDYDPDKLRNGFYTIFCRSMI